MEPEEAEDVRRLMSYAEETAGAMMTPEPVILGPDATIADALAQIRHAELPGVAGGDGLRLPAAARDADRASCSGSRTSSGCCASRRRPWSPPRSTRSMDPLHPEATIDEVAAHLATYNLVAAPVVDDDGHLLGAVTVDDLLDHMLPENWRDQPRAPATPQARRG